MQIFIDADYLEKTVPILWRRVPAIISLLIYDFRTNTEKVIARRSSFFLWRLCVTRSCHPIVKHPNESMRLQRFTYLQIEFKSMAMAVRCILPRALYRLNVIVVAINWSVTRSKK